MSEATVVMDVQGHRVEFELDGEAWHFHVPALRITGGGHATLDEALDEAGEAISFALDQA